MTGKRNWIVWTNTVIVAIMTISLNIIAYNAEEAKGLGFLYFAFIGLTINLVVLTLLTIFSYLLGQKIAGKKFLISIPISILTFLSVMVVFLLFGH